MCTKSGTYTTLLRISETVQWENVREICTKVFCDGCSLFPTNGWCWYQPNCKNTYKILAAMSVQWSSTLFCLIKADTLIPLGKVYLTVNKTLQWWNKSQRWPKEKGVYQGYKEKPFCGCFSVNGCKSINFSK